MRIDKWLKVTRLIKRRSVAQMACEQGRVFVNERPVKAAFEPKVDNQVHLELGSRAITVQVLVIPDQPVSVQQAPTLFRVIEEIRRAPESEGRLEDSII